MKQENIDSFEQYQPYFLNGLDLSKEQERELILKAKEGSMDAMFLLLQYHMLYIKFVVSFYCGSSYPQLDYMDYYHEGVCGFYTALQKFDVTKDVRFLTYASYWIRITIHDFFESQKDCIRFSKNFNCLRKRYQKLVEQFMIENYRKPTVEEIQSQLHISEQEVLLLQKYDHHLIRVDKELELEGNLPDLVIYEDYDTGCLQYDFLRAFERCHLTAKQRKVLILRYGLYGNRPKDAKAVAQVFHTTRQNILEIEKRALIKLQHNYQIRKLVDYLDDPDRKLVDGEIITYRKKK